MFKRMFLLFGVNILIIVMVSIILSILGVGNYMTAYGLDYQKLMIFCLVWGFAGSFISLMISKWMAKTMMGVEIVSPSSGQYGWVVQSIHSLSRKAGLTSMPEVGIYESNDVNAFATGPSKNNSLVAVSTGLLRTMNRNEVEGVLGHEVAHIANGDMVTMTLIQGVVNAFVMFFARIVAFAISQALRSNNDNERGGEGMGMLAHTLTVFIFEMIFGILGSMVVAWFSRYREFRADAASARLGGKEKMIEALRSLQRTYEYLHNGNEGAVGNQASAVRSLQISSKSSFLALLSTHPPLEERIRALEKNRLAL